MASVAATSEKASSAPLPDDPACACVLDSSATGAVTLYNQWCGVLAKEAQFAEWQGFTGAPIRHKWAEWEELHLTWTEQSDGSWKAPLNPGIWEPRLTFGASATGAGSWTPAFAAREWTVVSEDPPVIDYRVQFGLDEDGLPSGAQVETHIDFAMPMRSVWIEVNQNPGPDGSASTRCGIQFQHRNGRGSTATYTTIASLPWNAQWGGLVLSLAATNIEDLGIDRVVFDPPESGSEARRATRLIRVSFQSVAAALSQVNFPRPYRLEVVGSLAPNSNSSSLYPQFGANILGAYWPATDAKFRMNAHRVIAGTYTLLAEQDLIHRGLRPAIWYRDSSGYWQRYPLEQPMSGSSPDLDVDLIACSITDPFVDANGDTVMVVGGARVMRCTGSAPNDTCGKPHARAWVVKINATSYAATGAIVPTGVLPVSILGPEAEDVATTDGTVVDQSTVLDLKIVEGTTTRAVGIGSAGSWCGHAVGMPDSNTKAAAFLIAADGSGGYTGRTRFMDPMWPFLALTEPDSGPNEEDKASSSAATSWTRGEAAAWEHDVVGWFSYHTRCGHGLDLYCDLRLNGAEWGWSSWNWSEVALPATQDPTATHLQLYPVRRMVPWEGSGDDGAGNGGLRQAFAAQAAFTVSVNIPEIEEGALIVSSVGWLVNGCVDPGECPCDIHAGLFEYRAEVGGGCWSLNTGQAVPQTGTQSNGCLRILDLHQALWSPTNEPVWQTPYSKAAAVSARVLTSGELRRFVLGARFDAGPSGLSLAQYARSVMWFGSSPCLVETNSTCQESVLPESEWCGIPLDMLVHMITDADHSNRLWDVAETATNHVQLGYDLSAAGTSLVAARFAPTRPFDICLLRARADFNGDEIVDGADLGALLSAWTSTPTTAPAANRYDLTGDSLVDGADLGALLGAWGTSPVAVGCGDAAVFSNEIEIIILAAHDLGMEDLDDLMFTMSLMTNSERCFLASYLKMRSDIIASEEQP